MKKKKHNLAFGRVIRSLRKQCGFTQEILGFESGLDRTYISMLELGDRSPTLDTIFALLSPLNVTFAQLAALVEQEILNHE